MALLAEELVEEWLNRKGFFTIRGIKMGVQEMDLLAVRVAGKEMECRHVEVQVSINPIAGITPLSKRIQKETGRAPYAAVERTSEELDECVKEWIDKKFLMKKKQEMREKLAPGPWSYELVVNKVRYMEEVEAIRKNGVQVHFLPEVIADLRSDDGPVPSASGADFANLVLLGDASTD